MALAAICAIALWIVPAHALFASVDSADPLLVPADTIAGSTRDTGAGAAQDTAAARDTAVSTPPDTTASSASDTTAATIQSMWTMDELKRVLGEETGGIQGSEAYRERKNGLVAMACALLIPGLGQMYNEKPLKAAIALGLESYYLSQIAMNRRLREREKIIRDSYPWGSFAWKYHDSWVEEYWERSIDWIWWSGAVVLGVIIDAYVDARLDDMRFDVEARAADGDLGVSVLVRY